ncbi:MAG: NAD-dependent epimerase/dehydratase family protein [Candidatus Sumerlaeaceae bacterium]
MKILVTGATGFIGSRFCEIAALNGHEIIALVRPGRTYSRPWASVYGTLPYDVPTRAWAGVHACVHCAAITMSSARSESEAVNLDGTRFLLEAAKLADVQRFIFLSSQSAHEHAVSAYAITKREAEQVIRAAPVPYAILRPGLVYGPGELGLFWRMRQSIRKLPVLPLLGGGSALVQPVHVDDLCAAILKCLGLPPHLNEELNLGDPEGLPLREFLQEIEFAERGKRKLALRIPLGPVKAVVAAGEKLRLPLPISSDNLRGMEVVQRMDSAASLQRLGLTLRPIRAGMAESLGKSGTSVPAPRVEMLSSIPPPVRLLLIGAGKIGIVHALNARQREDEELVGIVDPNPKAFSLYKSMGFRTAYYTDIEQAVREQQPRAAIIATPASTHLELARWCMQRGLPALVEKPLAICPEDVLQFRTLARQYSDVPCAVGYMAAQFPHFGRAQQIIQSAVLGRVVSFRVLALQSHIMGAKPVRWEMIAAKSGGGALINFAGHVVSMVFRLFGVPSQVESARWGIHSTEVEDAVVAKLRYPDFSGELLSSWSAPGYPRPQNLVEVKCDRGTILIENFGTSIRSGGRTEQFWSQREFDVGYNASPDYTGAGFAAEHQNFIRAIRGEAAPDEFSSLPVGIEEAIQLEQWIFNLYRATPLQLPEADRLPALLANREMLEKAQQLRALAGSHN